MTRIISALATTLLAAGLSAQTFAAELPTSAIFKDEEASQQDVQRVNALADLGRLLGLGRRRHYEYSSRRNYRHYGYSSYSYGRDYYRNYGYPSYSYGRDYGYSPYYRYYGYSSYSYGRDYYRNYGYPSYSYGRHSGYSPLYRYYGGHGSRRGHSFGRH